MRSAVIFLLLSCAFFILSGAVLGCGGGNNQANIVTQVILSPTSLSLNAGDVIQLSAVAENSLGTVVATSVVNFIVTGGNVVTVSNSGLICAGTWDNLITPVVCTPGPFGTATVIGTAFGNNTTVNSNPVTVTVHPHIDSLLVKPVVAGGGSAPACISQGATPPANMQQYQAVALTRDAAYCSSVGQTSPCDVSSAVGAFSWASTASGVGIINTASQPSTQPPSMITVTAGNPGTSQIVAAVSGVTGTPATFSTCSPQSISIQLQSAPTPPDTPTSFSISASATRQLSATVLDTNGIAFNNIALNWVSSQPHVAAVNGSGLVTGVSPGSTSIVAGCTPPTCSSVNGLSYSNVVRATLGGTSAQTVYASSSATPASGASSTIIPIDNNTAGTAISLPTNATANSLFINNLGTIGFLGSEQGLIVFDPTGNRLTGTVSGATGRVIALTPDGTRVAISDAANPDPSKRVVYIYNQNSTTIVATLAIPNATAGAFSPDGVRLYMAAGNSVISYDSTQGQVTIPLSSAVQDVSVLASSQFGLAANGGDQLVATCNNTLAGNVSGVTPQFIRSSVDGEHIIDVNASQLDQTDISIPIATNAQCPPLLSLSAPTAYSFPGVSSFTPTGLVVSPDGTRALVTGAVGNLLVYTIGASAGGGSASVIPLANGAQALSAAVTLDGSTAYVGGSDNAVHVVNLGSGVDTQQIGLGFAPALIAIRTK